MKKYYLHSGTEQKGPFDLDDLKVLDISKDTPIWYEGLSEWTTIEKVKEVADVIKSTIPPPFRPVQHVKSEIPTEKTNQSANTQSKKRSIYITPIIVIIVIILGYLLVTKMNRESQSSYNESVKTIKEIEAADPTKFLDADGKYSENFWGDKINIEGTVNNTATVANYKDVVVRVTFFSKTNSIIKSEDYVVYDFFPAHQTKKFSLKVTNYKATASLGWEAIKATPY